MGDYERWRQIASGQAAPQPKSEKVEPSDRGDVKVLTVVAAAVLLLAADQVYLHHQVSQLNGLGQRIEAQAALQQEAQTKAFNDRMTALDDEYRKAARGRRAAEAEKPAEAPDAGLEAARAELKQSRAITEQLQATQQKQANDVARQLARKADQAQVGALSQDVSATRQDLDSTKKNLRQALEGLGMARTEFGTLIGRNHGEIEQLRQLGERDYYEFNLERSNQAQRVAGVGLELRKTDVKRLRYTLRLHVDDYALEKKDRTINEPIFFYVSRQSQPLELVVNKVAADHVSGYLSVPKGTPMAAARPAHRGPDSQEWEPFTELKSAAAQKGSSETEGGGPRP